MTSTRQPRRFPAPWSVEELTESFAIKDAKGFAVAYVYFSDQEQRRASMNRMTRDEARRIAVNIARLPALLGRSPPPPSKGEG